MTLNREMQEISLEFTISLASEIGISAEIDCKFHWNSLIHNPPPTTSTASTTRSNPRSWRSDRSLGASRAKFAVVGGAVPWLLLEAADMQHVGTIDIDLTLDAEALGDGDYVRLVEALMGHGYAQSGEHRRFQLVRTINMANGAPVDVIVDFLMPRDAEIEKNIPPLPSEFAVQRASGAELAVPFINWRRLKARCLVVGIIACRSPLPRSRRCSP